MNQIHDRGPPALQKKSCKGRNGNRVRGRQKSVTFDGIKGRGKEEYLWEQGVRRESIVSQRRSSSSDSNTFGIADQSKSSQEL